MELKLFQGEKKQVYLLFYKPTKNDPFQNRLVAFFNGPFCHVEMAFPRRNGDEPWERVVWGSSIYQNESVFYQKKNYSREGYVSFAIEVSEEQLHKIKAFCKHHSSIRTPFSLPAMYAAYLPWQVVYTNSTFCSKHVVQALQHAGVPLVDDINPSLATPSKLHQCLMTRQRKAGVILQVVPSRMQPAAKHASAKINEHGALILPLLGNREEEEEEEESYYYRPDEEKGRPFQLEKIKQWFGIAWLISSIYGDGRGKQDEKGISLV